MRGWVVISLVYNALRLQLSKFIENIFIIFHPDCLPATLPLSNKLNALLERILNEAISYMNKSSAQKSAYRYFFFCYHIL